MESTFARSVDGDGAHYLGKSSTFDRDTYAFQLNDAYKSISSYNQTKAATLRSNIISSHSKIDYCRLKPHELFPGSTIDKPIPCKRLPNMPKVLENYCSAESAHYVGRSYSKVLKMIKDKNWETLFDFSYNSCIEIIREYYREMEIDDDFMCADTPLFLEHGVVKGILSYPEYYEVMQLVKINEKRQALPLFTQAHDYYRNVEPIQEKYDYYHDSTIQ